MKIAVRLNLKGEIESRMDENDDYLDNESTTSPPNRIHTQREAELSALIGAPTARSNFVELKEELDAYVSAYVDGSHKTDDPHQLAVIKHGIDLMAFFKPMLGKAYKLGVDEAIFPSTLRFCPDCPKGNRRPLAKRRRYCPEHKAQRRRITYRLSKRSKKKQMSTVSTVNPRCDNVMSEQDQKRTIIGLMREKGLSLEKAAKRAGVLKLQASRWCISDNEFYRAVTTARLASYAGIILEADDLVRSGKTLDEGEKLFVETAIWMRDYIAFLYPDQAGFLSPECAERGRKAIKGYIPMIADLNDHELAISKLLSVRLTKFQYGFCLGLQGHAPTPEQVAILRRIVSRYSNIWNYINESKEQKNNAEPKRNSDARCYTCVAV